MSDRSDILLRQGLSMDPLRHSSLCAVLFPYHKGPQIPLHACGYTVDVTGTRARDILPGVMPMPHRPHLLKRCITNQWC